MYIICSTTSSTKRISTSTSFAKGAYCMTESLRPHVCIYIYTHIHTHLHLLCEGVILYDRVLKASSGVHHRHCPVPLCIHLKEKEKGKKKNESWRPPVAYTTGIHLKEKEKGKKKNESLRAPVACTTDTVLCHCAYIWKRKNEKYSKLNQTWRKAEGLVAGGHDEYRFSMV